MLTAHGKRLIAILPSFESNGRPIGSHDLLGPIHLGASLFALCGSLVTGDQAWGKIGVNAVDPAEVTFQ